VAGDRTGARAEAVRRANAAVGALARRAIPVEFQPPPVGFTRRLVARTGYFRLRTMVAAHGDRIPDAHLYQPLYSPWLGDPAFERVYAAAEARTLVSRDRCFVLWRTLQQALHLEGDLLECGVFRGGTALLEATTVRDQVGERPLHLVDSFVGMPDTTEGVDRFREGDFSSTSFDDVRQALSPFPFARVHRGFIPEVLDELGIERLAWAYIDVDIYAAVRDSLEFIYPRLAAGGVIVLDDYGFPSSPGVRRAMDEFFADDRPEVPLCLPTGQGLVVKLP
jgi:O-methyltransferase